MGLIDTAIGDIPDEKVVEPGIYELRITSLKRKTSKRGNEMIQASFEIAEEPNSKPVFDFFTEPTDAMDERTVMSNLRRWKSFLMCFGFDPTQPVGESIFEEAKGLTGHVQLSKDDDPQYGLSNRVANYMIDN